MVVIATLVSVTTALTTVVELQLAQALLVIGAVGLIWATAFKAFPLSLRWWRYLAALSTTPIIAAIVLAVSAGDGSRAAGKPTPPARPRTHANLTHYPSTSGVPREQSPKRVVRIGVIYPKSGTDGSAGRDTFRGIELARDYLNDGSFSASGLPIGGGRGLPSLHGATIKLVPENSQSKCGSAHKLFNKLAKGDHVAAVIGAYESTVTLQAIYAADALHVPLVNDASTAQSFTRDDGRKDPPARACKKKRPPDRTPSRWFFRIGPTEEQAATAFKQLLLTQNHRIRRVAILYERNDIYGDSVLAATRQMVRDVDSRIMVHPYPYRTVLGASRLPCSLKAELDARIRKLKSFNPNVVFAASYAADAIAAVQTMRHLDYTPPAMLVYGAGYEDPDFFKNAQAGDLDPQCPLPGVRPDGIITRVSWSPKVPSTGPVGDVANAFKVKTGKPMTDNSARGFTAMMVLAKAIEDAGSLRRQDIRDALSGLKLRNGQTIMPWGNGSPTRYAVVFDRNGQNTRAAFLLEQKRGTGSAVVDQSASSALIGPLDWSR